MTQEKLQQIDARAFKLGLSLSALAAEAEVSRHTMAKLRRNPESVRPRAFTKLEAALERMEAK